MNPERLEKRLTLLACPLCGSAFSLQGGSLICEKRHCFDISKKGVVHLAPGHLSPLKQYTAPLFESRRRILEAEFYQPVWEGIRKMVESHSPGKSFSLADIGCGEGFYSRALAAAFPESLITGIDLSREAIEFASRGERAVQYFIADLKRLPFQSGSMDFLLDVLTPADYGEFARVLKPTGFLIKVIPGDHYLQEIRTLAAGYLKNADTYSNRETREHLLRHGDVIQRVDICQCYPLSTAQREDFLRMTPMTMNLPGELPGADSLDEITIHMEIYLCRLPSPALSK